VASVHARRRGQSRIVPPTDQTVQVSLAADELVSPHAQVSSALGHGETFCGMACAAECSITLLKLTEHPFLVVEHSLEIYGGLVAAIFSALGIWLGINAHPKKRGQPARPRARATPLNRTRSALWSSTLRRAN
jgi:hypothetical protein